jgi:endonuclease/exonuclease/phosphatase family metal-dependent hydrolase
MIVILPCALHGQDSFSIMTYNLLKYPGTNSGERNPYFKEVISAVRPDILVVQEMNSQDGVHEFLSQVLDRGYTAGLYVDGPDTDNAMYYNALMFRFISNVPIATDLRDITEFTLVHVRSGDTLRIFSAHLKASSGIENEARRLTEVRALRARTKLLPDDATYIMVGDFNLYGSSEPAYQELLATDSAGYFSDPINMPGNWHNNEAFAAIHTQSSREEQTGGGASGGVDDRFDFILMSPALFVAGGSDYVEGSYKAFGNDGLHFNSSINELPENSAVGQELADALYHASDHLPVMASIAFNENTKARFAAQLGGPELQAVYPNPVLATSSISYKVNRPQNVKLLVYDLLGNLVLTLTDSFHSPGSYVQEFSASALPPGMYYYSLLTESVVLSRSMIVSK